MLYDEGQTMKIINSKASIALIVSFFVSISPVAQGITPLKSYSRSADHDNKKDYSFNCRLINARHVVKGLGLLIYYRATHQKKNLDMAIQSIQNQLAEYKVWLLQEEQNALLALKNKYQMSDSAWHAYTNDLNELKQIYNEAIKNSWHNTNHDQNIPLPLFNALEKNKINPHSITLTMRSDQPRGVHMLVRSAIKIDRNSSTDKLIVKKTYVPLVIEIFPALHKNSSPEKTIALCSHEVEHIIQHHGLTDVLIQLYLEHYCSIDPATLDRCPEYQTLMQIHEAQAEVLSAIKDPQAAACLTEYRSTTFYPQYLYEEHYSNLSDVNMLWQLDAWLTFIHENGFKNKAQNIVAKMNTLADSFKKSLFHL